MNRILLKHLLPILVLVIIMSAGLMAQNDTTIKSGINNNPNSVINQKVNIISVPVAASNTNSCISDNAGTGLITDETITKLGHDFYEIFYNNFQAPEDIAEYSIIITEKPQPRLGALVTVKLNDLEVYQSFLQPKYDMIEEVALDAVDQCTAYLQNYEAIIKELQGEDMDGNGIY